MPYNYRSRKKIFIRVTIKNGQRYYQLYGPNPRYLPPGELTYVYAYNQDDVWNHLMRATIIKNGDHI